MPVGLRWHWRRLSTTELDYDTLINIALSSGTVEEPMYGGQPFIQSILLLCAVGSVPVLLLAKPYFLSKQTHHPIYHHDEETPFQSDGHDEVGDEHGFGEIVIRPTIETIEFILGSFVGFVFGPHGIGYRLLGESNVVYAQYEQFHSVLLWFRCLRRCYVWSVAADGCFGMFSSCIAIALGGI
jgi:hypothetical protein